jgi:hypothetical protein
MLRKPPITGQFSNVPSCLSKKQESLHCCGVTLFMQTSSPRRHVNRIFNATTARDCRYEGDRYNAGNYCDNRKRLSLRHYTHTNKQEKILCMSADKQLCISILSILADPLDVASAAQLAASHFPRGERTIDTHLYMPYKIRL